VGTLLGGVAHPETSLKALPTNFKNFRPFRCRRRASGSALIAIVALCFVGSACDENGKVATTTPSSTVTEAPSSEAGTGYSITAGSDGFEPDSLTVPSTEPVLIVNGTKDDLVLSVDGDGSSRSSTIDLNAGETVVLTLPGPGAYIITSPGNTDLTATVMVNER
jgi:hypothetical protein